LISRTPGGLYALDDARVRGRVAGLGAMVFPDSPADLGRIVVEETEKWAKVAKFAGVKPD